MASRASLIQWINSVAGTEYTRIEQCANGGAYCHLLASIYDDVPLSKVTLSAVQPSESMANYAVLQKSFASHGLDKSIPVTALAHGKITDTLAFLQYLRHLADSCSADSSSAMEARPRTASASPPRSAIPMPRATSRPASPEPRSRLPVPTSPGRPATSVAVSASAPDPCEPCAPPLPPAPGPARRMTATDHAIASAASVAESALSGLLRLVIPSASAPRPVDAPSSPTTTTTTAGPSLHIASLTHRVAELDVELREARWERDNANARVALVERVIRDRLGALALDASATVATRELRSVLYAVKEISSISLSAAGGDTPTEANVASSPTTAVDEKAACTVKAAQHNELVTGALATPACVAPIKDSMRNIW
ncbi:hypothetical protein SeLEV6574_g01488 [Synchytrium endobioticum]|uniref:Calponin-homology (CH) domain-containing protein n=1 Tax=Synchytrium endobioticum TaxID=286115 RepID=A0A507DCU8_9FUNG|nr:hypothetical protein SeLEV6574_g01488 [Synchytrium endobioticum]